MNKILKIENSQLFLKNINIYTKLINYFNIYQFQWEIEDLCFHYLNPNEYKRIVKILYEHHINREQYIENVVFYFRKTIQKKGLNAKIYGRPKHIYSIWCKMQKKNLEFNKLFDLYAIRIIVKHLQDCYTALNIVHNNFRYLPNEFDDYISNPKSNGYQSIHTVILGPYGRLLEIQIRTYKMHNNAELGIAAHWKYKEKN